MTINKEVIELLKVYHIDKSQGLLCLLAYYFKLDADSTCSEETVKAISLTKIVTIDYEDRTMPIKWNIALFEDQQIQWEWVKEWNNRWNVNMDRKAGSSDVLKRMQDFFAKYPNYRVVDINNATDNYFASVRDKQYLKNSAAFIFDGAGAMKKSILLSWCEKLNLSNEADTNMRGRIVT